MVAALCHASGTVVAQQAVEAKSNEIPTMPELVEALSERKRGGDHRRCAAHPDRLGDRDPVRQPGYVFTVKSNQPSLLDGL